jgi:uncharacterized protein (DUF302 family)
METEMSMDVRQSYSISKRIAVPYEEAVEKAKAALKEEGFGVLTEIDVRKTMKEKLDVDFRNYVILGSCNPGLAHRALEVELEIGLLLPCNVIVYEEDDGSVVAAQNPEAAMGVLGNRRLEAVAHEARVKLEHVIRSL